MKPTLTYTKNLDRLAALLRQRPLTAVEIAKLLKCCKPTVYARLRALEARGEPVFTLLGSASGTGPRPMSYGITAG